VLLATSEKSYLGDLRWRASSPTRMQVLDDGVWGGTLSFCRTVSHSANATYGERDVEKEDEGDNVGESDDDDDEMDDGYN
jgi:hypothetical protein